MYGIYYNGAVIAQFVTPMSVTNYEPVSVTDALSLKRFVNKRPVQRWEIQSSLEPLSFGANKLFALLVVKGNSDILQVVTPQNYGAIQSLTANNVITATGSAGATTVSIVNSNGLIPMGTFIRFSNHSKVYMVTDDISGDGSLHLFPELRTTIAGSTMYYRKDVLMNCKVDTSTINGMSFTNGILMDLGQIKLVEDV